MADENVQVVLARRPEDVPQREDFALRTAPVPAPGPGEFLVRLDWWSADPAQRGWALDAPNYLPPVEIGAPMRAFAAGVVVASRHPDFAEGARVSGRFGWQRYALSDGTEADAARPPDDLPLSYAVGALGLTGFTAWLGLTRILGVASGETLVVSSAAGAVGSVAGQIAAARGVRAVGIAGGPEKAALAREAFGYAVGLDYRADGFAAALAEALPRGTDAYFDNTAGPISDAVMTHLAQGARIAICGTAAITRWSPLPQGPRVHRQLLVARARMEGFLAFDHEEARPQAVAELAGLIRDGRLAVREHVLEGPEAARDAIAMLYRGENRGKLVIAVG